MYICVYIYIYIHIYTCMYTYIYIYIYIYLGDSASNLIFLITFRLLLYVCITFDTIFISLTNSFIGYRVQKLHRGVLILTGGSIYIYIYIYT
jgi:hypothetical protein